MAHFIVPIDISLKSDFFKPKTISLQFSEITAEICAQRYGHRHLQELALCAATGLDAARRWWTLDSCISLSDLVSV